MNETYELRLPETFNLDDLGISLTPEGELFSRVEPLLDVLEFNGIPASLFLDRPYFKLVCLSALTECYRLHLAQGGVTNPILDNFANKAISKALSGTNRADR